MSAVTENAPSINDVPDELLDLAKEALRRGFAKVRLGFEGMGYEFPAPIGWMLWLDKTGSRRSYEKSIAAVTIDAQRSCFDTAPDGSRFIDAHAAYVGHRPDTLSGGGDYWGLERVRAWLDEPVEDEGQWLPAWSPVTDEANQEVLLEDWDDFTRAARGGWCVEREIEEVFGFEGLSMIKLKIDAVNNFYNVEGHPQHRDTDAKLSRELWRSGTLSDKGAGLAVQRDAALSEILMNEDGSYTIPKFEGAEVEAILDAAPWFVPVASFTPDTEDADGEWVLPREATDWKQG